MAVVTYHNEEQLSVRAALPSHLAALLAVLSATLLVSLTVGSNYMGTMLFLLSLFGATIALAIRASRLPRPLAYLLSLMFVACVGIMIVTDPRLFSLALPMEAYTTRDLALLSTMGYLCALTTFFHVRFAPQLFSLVFCLSVFGLAGQLSVNLDVPATFFVFIIASVFLIGYHRLVHQGVVHSAQAIGPGVARAAADHLLATCLVFVLVLGLGSVLAFGLSHISPKLFTSALVRMNTVLDIDEEEEPFGLFDAELRAGVGPIYPANLPIMYVKSSEPAYWRAEIYNLWTGTSWLSATSQYEEMEFAPRQRPASLERRDRHERLLTQEFTLAAPLGMKLPAAATPVRVISRSAKLEIDEMGLVNASTVLGKGDKYTVVSRVNTTRPSILRRAGEEYPAAVYRQGLLAVRDSAAALVPLAMKICMGAKTPYDKMVALKRYLEKTCAYRLTAAPYDPARDIAVQFVLERREGICTEFASALALMGRAVGVPTRVVSGFAPGTWDPELGAWVVTDADRHAWVEAYFPNVGWIPFDCQPERVIAISFAERLFTSLSAAARKVLGVLRRYLLTLALIIPLAWIVVYSRRNSVVKLVQRKRYAGPYAELEQLYARACRLLRPAVGPCSPATTAGELLARASESLRSYPAALRVVRATIGELVRLRFSRVQPSAEELHELRARVRELGVAVRHAVSLKNRGLPRIPARAAGPAPPHKA